MQDLRSALLKAGAKAEVVGKSLPSLWGKDRMGGWVVRPETATEIHR